MGAGRPKSFKFHAPAPPERLVHRDIHNVFCHEIARPGHVSRAGVTWWSVDHADYGGHVPGTRSARGVIAGIPDTILIYQGHAFFIEIKSETGHLSDPQCELATGILICGARFGVARDAGEALRLLDVWQIPRSHRIRGLEAPQHAPA